MPHVLIVDDDPYLREVVRYALAREGFTVREAEDGADALAQLEQQPADLVVLDVLMPEMDGLEVCRRLRRTSRVPILFLSSRGEELDRVLGLELGGDDYLTKPFSTRELVSRVKAVLRRTVPGGEGEKLSVAGLEVDGASQRVTARGEPVHLGPTEYRLLHFFVSHPDRVYTREQVLDRVWGRNVYVEERTVDVHIRRLRKALEPFGCEGLIQTVRGTGYRFSEKV